MSDELQTVTPLAVVAARRPEDGVYNRALRLSSRRYWLFSVAFWITAYCMMTAVMQLPAYLGVENPATEQVIRLYEVALGIALFLLLFRATINRKLTKQAAFARARREVGTPSAYHFYEEYVACIGFRDRFVVRYADVESAIEDRHGFYLYTDGIVLILPTEGMTAYDTDFIRTILRERLPNGVYRRRKCAESHLFYPHPIPLYPDRAVEAPQVSDLPHYHRSVSETFTGLLGSTLPVLSLLMSSITVILVLVCDLQESWMPYVVFAALLSLSLFPLYGFARKHRPSNPWIGLSQTEDGWRLYHKAGEFFLLPDEVIAKRNGDVVVLYTAMCTLVATVDECREVPAIAAQIGL